MKKKFLASVLALAAIPAAIFGGCSQEENNGITRYNKTIYIFGTSADLVLYGDFNSDEAQSAATEFGIMVEDYLFQLEAEISTSYTTSYVYAFNAAAAGETVELSKDTYNILSVALEMYSETDGYYNAGVYNSVNLFGFGENSSGISSLPDQDYIQAYASLAQSFSKITLSEDNGRYYAVKPADTVTVGGNEYSLSIDLGGIAKGYATDVISGMIADAGYSYGYISFGSSSMYIAQSYTSEDGLWTLTVRNPRSLSGDYYMTVRVADITVSTSGDYENYYEADGVRFCHIINPFTGIPVNVEYADGAYSQTAGIISATVLGGSAAENDARTTALMAMGLDKAIEYINSDEFIAKDIQVYIVYRTQSGELQLVTNVSEGSYTLTDADNFTLASSVTDGKVNYTG
ncbi:MAG: FAD:protein FMN transferase [Clostridia bacterium]|nr:FAD:protein FMN transferase [Clostridia bacterium]